MATQERRPEDVYMEILLAVFALAAVRHRHRKTPVERFHRLMMRLQAEFPQSLPMFRTSGSGPYAYSETLAGALKHALAKGLQMSVSGRSLEMTGTHAWMILAVLRLLNGELFVRRMIPVADRLVEILAEAD